MSVYVPQETRMSISGWCCVVDLKKNEYYYN